MKHVIPAAIALSLIGAGIAQAQTSSSGNTGATSNTTTTTPNTPAPMGAAGSRNGANTTSTGPSSAAATAPSGTVGSPNTATTGTGALGTAPVGSPNATTRTDTRATTTHDANSNNAVNTRAQNNPGAPHAGANSFTEGQARSRIQDKGFSQVTDLKKDDQGIWRGHAMKDGKQTNVALDFQGNVVAQ